MFNYRITLVYSDAYSREIYVENRDGVANLVRDALCTTISKPILTVHIAYIGG